MGFLYFNVLTPINTPSQPAPAMVHVSRNVVHNPRTRVTGKYCNVYGINPGTTRRLRGDWYAKCPGGRSIVSSGVWGGGNAIAYVSDRGQGHKNEGQFNQSARGHYAEITCCK